MSALAIVLAAVCVPIVALALTALVFWMFGIPITIQRQEPGHDDRDFYCRYWWGDRSDSLRARCPVCNPEGVVPHG